jgi:hypothetical protein
MIVHIVSTLDGRITAFDRETGKKVWEVTEYLEPMVNVQEFSNPLDQRRGSFIPEIASGIGRLYYYSNEGMVLMKIPLKQIINDHSVFVDEKYVFTGQKLVILLKIDANTGQLLNVYGQDNANPQINQADDVIFLSRTTYRLLIYDKQSSALRWNISYGEYGAALSSNINNNVDLSSQIEKGRLLVDPKVILESTVSPVMASFDAFIDRNGNRQLIKAYSIKETDASFIDEIDGSLYIMPSLKEPLMVSKCEIGSPLYQECMARVQPRRDLILADKITDLIQTHKITDLIQTDKSPNLDFAVYVQTFGFGVVILIAVFILFKRSNKQNGSAKPVSIQVSDTVLGVGSHGTIVYSGKFENRPVAVKRLLREFYDLADSEVRLLQESDSHPNVVRYYFKEECHQFTYLALELCRTSLYDMVERQDSDHQSRTLWQSMDPRDAIHQILSGLGHLHSLNIVHRDIKPQVRLFH